MAAIFTSETTADERKLLLADYSKPDSTLRVLITPVVSVGWLLYGLLHLVGIPVRSSTMISVAQAAASAARRLVKERCA